MAILHTGPPKQSTIIARLGHAPQSAQHSHEYGRASFDIGFQRPRASHVPFHSLPRPTSNDGAAPLVTTILGMARHHYIRWHFAAKTMTLHPVKMLISPLLDESLLPAIQHAHRPSAPLPALGTRWCLADVIIFTTPSPRGRGRCWHFPCL